MFKTLLKYLRSEAGWISGAIMLGSAIANGVMGSQKQKALNKKFNQSGEEKNLANATTALFPARQESYDLANLQTNRLNQGWDAAAAGGLMPRISDAFSDRPNTSELEAIRGQEQQLKNNVLNSGARGGLLRKQMLEASKNAATNTLGVMENARQNANNRAFGIFNNMAPSQASEAAGRNRALAYEGLVNQNWKDLAQLGTNRNLAQAGGLAKDASGSGAGLGGMLGGLFGGGGGGGLGGLLGGLGGLFGGGSNGGFIPGSATGFEGGFF